MSEYTTENEYGYLGKYQMGLAALEDAGFVKQGTYAAAKLAGYSDGKQNNANTILNDPNVWTGKEGVDNKAAFFENTIAQESAQEELLFRNYNTLLDAGVLTINTPQGEIAGKLMASQVSGTSAVIEWDRSGLDTSNDFGISISQYYNLGRSSAI